MPINASLGSPLYEAYANKGPCLGLILPAIPLNFIAFCGVAMNLFVVFVTLRTKSLHGSANFMLALISFCEVLHQSGHAVFLVIAVSGVNFVDFVSAVLLQLPLIFGLNASLIAMALAAFDRLFALIAPNLHKTMNQKIYLFLLTSCCIVYGLYWDYYQLYYAQQKSDVPVSGMIADVLDSPKFFAYTSILNGISIAVYFLVWILIRGKTGVTKQTNSRLLKSLLIIVVINIGGYLVSLSFYQLVFYLMQVMDFSLIWHLGFIPGCVLNIGAACNAPVLYYTSSEYRKAFAHYLRKMHFPCAQSPTKNGNGTLFVVQGAVASNSRNFTTKPGQQPRIFPSPATITMHQITMARKT